MNLGDAAGDAYFAIFKLGVPAMCRNSTFGPCTPSTNIQGFNVFMQFVIETDERLGPYAQCNPDVDTGVYKCEHWFGGSDCWFNTTTHPEWTRDFADVCSFEECQCPALQHAVIGREAINETSPFPQGPAQWPQQCSMSFQAVGPIVFDERVSPLLKRFNSSEGDCCAACDSDAMQPPAVPFSESCFLTTYFRNTSICELHGFRQVKSPKAIPMPGAYSAFRQPPASPAQKVTKQSFGYMGRTLMPGAWYSAPSGGHCKEGQVMGKDCWWRLVSTGRTVNSSCVDARMSESIVKRNQSCFDSCEDASDQSSDCWIKCFFDIIVGNNGHPGVTRPEVLEPFERAFLPMADGGCPDVPPCTEPCLPPCWAVPKGEPCNQTSALPFGLPAEAASGAAEVIM
eukprot:CAMPEP_0195118686 /NCGR_PEP_ID=MMETSP0448-20130528/117615_1 /TAXON_ID=66468 /ORGANISM="Heterocapsa triquestra, Strain CCMP 448" /LENGTH=397 /DNA_ID=CAMNT_0040155965 /DNA_START=116 /DNA_END=1309 /DNA_ORIENTATION=-